MARPTPASGFASVNDVCLHYLDYGGNGPPAVLHHATGFHAWVWARLVEEQSTVVNGNTACLTPSYTTVPDAPSGSSRSAPETENPRAGLGQSIETSVVRNRGFDGATLSSQVPCALSETRLSAAVLSTQTWYSSWVVVRQ